MVIYHTLRLKVDLIVLQHLNKSVGFTLCTRNSPSILTALKHCLVSSITVTSLKYANLTLIYSYSSRSTKELESKIT